jgi:hypothetical protein
MAACDVHIYPLNDHWCHILDGTECPCEPTINPEGGTLIIVHNSFDHREIVEEAIRIMNGQEDSEAPKDIL